MGAELLRVRGIARHMQERAEATPLRWVGWTPPQADWLARRHPRKLLRAGNQIGKTWAAMAEVIWRCTGTHPHYPTREPPIEAWVVCTSWSQSVAIMGKFWELCPRDVLRPGVRFDPRHGFGRDSPAVVFRNGSIVRFRTTNQGPEALAGATVDYVAIDEPTDPDIYRELDKRVMRRSGAIGITLTPINRPCEWLRKLVDAKIVDEVHAVMSVENLTPVGASDPMRLLDGTPMDAAWIASLRLATPAMWAPVILDGEWEARPEGVFFKCFDPKKHVRAVKLDPRRGAVYPVLGFDYATADRDLGHAAVLLQVQPYRDAAGRVRERIVALDEVALVGTATNAEFAQRVIAMLERNGLQWRDLHAVHGDNPVQSRWVQKSNINTMRALAVELAIPYDALQPRVLNAKDHQRSAGSRGAGCQFMYERIASFDFMVHPRCETLIRGLEQWDYTDKHPLKDVVDAARYAAKPFIFPGGGSGPVVRTR